MYPIMSLRSAHLPCDSSLSFRNHYASSYCSHCDVQLLLDADRARLTDDEVRWRHVQHLLTSCTDQCDGRAPRPLLSELTEDLLDAATGYPDALDVVRTAFYTDPAVITAARATTVQYMLEPVESCPGPADVALAHAQLVAAYITLVAASVPHPLRDGPAWRLHSMRLPAHSRMHKHARAQEDEPDSPRTRETISSASRSTSESMDEAWLRAETPPAAYVCTVITQSVCPPGSTC